jgi:hypothetical protein
MQGYENRGRGYNGNPWEAQQRFNKQKEPVALKPQQQISGIKNEIFLLKESVRLSLSPSADHYIL